MTVKAGVIGIPRVRAGSRPGYDRVESWRPVANSLGNSPMSVSTPSPARSRIVYPDSDGKPMAENTLQFEWIVTIKEGLERALHDRPDIFVAGDLHWYPVEGRPDICVAPDALVAIGRPKGYRGSYTQWEE